MDSLRLLAVLDAGAGVARYAPTPRGRRKAAPKPEKRGAT